eukprot:TRINITY_DN18789_c0_g1_i1.p1 TRINITY_DN18789_c0_g1~~TRINITY_DN18789_c0_g1_i1.p1  ORF type:complete len:3233 (+),score=874.67 TRINITY_DN18789_c0_g1_i1:664-9699(+)
MSPFAQVTCANKRGDDWKKCSPCGNSCRMLIHGGFGSEGSPLGDLWEFFNGTFTRLSPSSGGAPVLAGHSAVWDSARGTALLFGGIGPGEFPTNDLWELLLDNGTWTMLEPPGGRPTPRAYHAAALLPSNPQSPPRDHVGIWEQQDQLDVMIVYGGMVMDGTELVPTKELWSYRLDIGQWSLLAPSPGGYVHQTTRAVVPPFPVPERGKHACWRVGQRMLCNGGWTAGAFEDTVEYDAALNRLYPSALNRTRLPTKLHGAAGVYSQQARTSFVLGGTAGGPTSLMAPSVFYASFVQPPQCEAGRFSPDGDYRCYPCPSGWASSLYRCTECVGGSYVSPDLRSCFDCPPGHYTLGNGSSNVTDCMPCPAGTRLLPGSGGSLDDCEPCPLGSYSNVTGQAECSPCPAGTYGTALGSASLYSGCTVCPYGSASAAGSTQCETCPAGSQSGAIAPRLSPHSLQITHWGQTTDSCGSRCPAVDCFSSCHRQTSISSQCDDHYAVPCTSGCPTLMCGSCGPQYGGTVADYTIEAGEPLFVQVQIFDSGGLPQTRKGAPYLTGTSSCFTAPYAPCRQQFLRGDVNFDSRPSSAVTVEKIDGPGSLEYGCLEPYPAACTGTLANGVPGDTGALGVRTNKNTCWQNRRQTGTSYPLWYFYGLRFDTATPETTLVFRSEGLLAARITLRVTGKTLTVVQQPPNFTIATEPFTVSVVLGDPLGNADPTATDTLTVRAPDCVQMVDGVAQSNAMPASLSTDGSAYSTSQFTSQGPLAGGRYTFTFKLSGPVATATAGLAGTGGTDDRGTMLRCRLSFVAAVTGQPTADSEYFIVQQPDHVHVRHVTSAFAGQPIQLHAEVRDPDGVLVRGDNRTWLWVQLLRAHPLYPPDYGQPNTTFAGLGPNATLQPALRWEGSGLRKRAAMGVADFVVTLSDPTDARILVAATHEYGAMTVRSNDSIFVHAAGTNTTQLGVADPVKDPGLPALPTQVMANQTFWVGVRAEDDYGNVDVTASFVVSVALEECDGDTALSEANSTELFAVARLLQGRAQVPLRLHGEGSTTCRLRFAHVPSADDPTDFVVPRSVLSDPIALVNPHSVLVEWGISGCTELLSCPAASCRAAVGEWIELNATLQDKGGTTLTAVERAWINITHTAGAPGHFEYRPGGQSFGAMAPVESGMARFWFRPLRHTYQQLQLQLAAGWAEETVTYNETYALAGAGGDLVVMKAETGRGQRHLPWAFMDPGLSCLFTVAVVATRLEFAELPMEWIPAGRPITLTLRGVDSLGYLDTDLSGTAMFSVKNCEGGLPTHPTFYLVSGSTSTLFTDSSALATLSGGQATVQIKGEMLWMHWEHSPAYKTIRGAYGCILQAEMSPTPSGYSTLKGEWEPFELVQLADLCTACPLGSWSPGGDGTAAQAYQLALATAGSDPYLSSPVPGNDAVLSSPTRAFSTGRWGENHPGGCTPCMAGTYSTVDRASTVDHCVVCPPGSGYQGSPGDARAWSTTDMKPAREGLTACLSCSGGSLSTGSVGGGSCRSVVEVQLNTNPSGGRTGTYCQSAACGGCPQGQYSLVCSDYTSSGQSECNTGAGPSGYCYWDAAQSACKFVNLTDEPRKCVNCPPGTYQHLSSNSAGYSSCGACSAGSYSANSGHAIIAFGDRDPRGCFQDRQRMCIGAGTGQCPDGTYGVDGAVNSSQCITCPKGTWSRRQYLTLGNVLCSAGGSGYPYPVGTCGQQTGAAPQNCTYSGLYGTCCGACRISSLTSGGTCTSATSYSYLDPVGMHFCFKCPPGTYSTAEGATGPETCVPCPAGYYCPAGSGEPVAADSDAVLLNLALKAARAGGGISAEQRALLEKYPDAQVGQIPTRAYSLEGMAEPMPCDLEAVNDCPMGLQSYPPVSGRNCYPNLRDAEGLIRDGHFSQFMWKESYPNEFGADGNEGFTDHWNHLGTSTAVSLDTTVDHTRPENSALQTCQSAGGSALRDNYGATSGDGQTGTYYCCPTTCDVSNGGPGCGGTTACASTAWNASCCKATIHAAGKTCGPGYGPPCIIPGYSTKTTGAAVSGSLRLNASVSDNIVSQIINVGMLNKGVDLYGRVWGRNEVTAAVSDVTAGPTSRTMTPLNGSNETEPPTPASGVPSGEIQYGIRWEVFEDAEWLANNTPFLVTETVPTNNRVQVPFRTGTDLWAVGESTIPLSSAARYVRATPFVSGAYLGTVWIDDVSLRVHPQHACNCSLGYFYNESRLSVPFFTTPCQRCPHGHQCRGGLVTRCPDKSYTQGGSHLCLPCPAGWLCDYDGRGSSTPCPDYTYEVESAEIDKCKLCPLGYACRGGKRHACNYGAYGDGGKHCQLCWPGFYSNISSGPVIECTRCPPGWETNYMRTECIPCPVNKYSWNGTRCTNCPPYTFTRDQGNWECEGCNITVLPPRTVRMARNQLLAPLHLTPEKCVPGLEWRVEGVTHIGTPLGRVEWQNPPEVDALGATYFLNKDTLGSDELVFTVTSAVGAPIQSVTVTVIAENSAPQAYDDVITISHPNGTSVVLELGSLLENDLDPDNDDFYISSWAWERTWGHQGILDTDVEIDPGRRTLRVRLPGDFTGPMAMLKYSLQDRLVDPASCVAPECLISTGDTAYGIISITAKDAPPLARDDAYDILPSGRMLLDVLANDTDTDGDFVSLTVSRGQLVGGQQVVPVIREVCPHYDGGAGTNAPTCPAVQCSVGQSTEFPSGSGTTWYGVVNAGQTVCSCVANTTSGRCDVQAYTISGSVVTLIPIPRFYIEYSAIPGMCGSDQFTYSLKGNEDLATPATVTMTVKQCVCTGVSVAPGIDVVIMLDGTGPDVGMQWSDMKAFAQSLQERFDFTSYSGGVKWAVIQYAGSGPTATYTVHRGINDADAGTPYTAWGLTDKLGAVGDQQESMECPLPPCADIAPAMYEVATSQLKVSDNSRRKAIAVIHGHGFADSRLAAGYAGDLRDVTGAVNAPARVYLFSVGLAAQQSAAALNLQHALVTRRGFADYAALLTDSAVFSDTVDHMCATPS